MSGPVDRKIISTAIGGSKNFVQNEGVIISIGEQINQTILPSNPPRETSIWYDMKEPLKLFTGRVKELEDLHNMMKQNQNQNNMTVISQMTSINGLGGIGKSELARMYANKYCKCYCNNVIWINAESHASIGQSFFILAKDRLNISSKSTDGKDRSSTEIIYDVYNYFANKKCLFIFDNAEQLKTTEEPSKSEGISEFLPSLPPKSNKPFILITSRNCEWNNMNILNLGPFTENEATEFVIKALNIEITENDDSEEQMNDIKKLIKMLEYFPLGLQLAVAYIREENAVIKILGNRYTIGDYIKDYNSDSEKTKKLLHFKFPKNCEDKYTDSISTTWLITFDKIKGNKECGEIALKILNMITYFAPDNIPIDIFYYMGEESKIGHAIKLLQSYSFVSIDERMKEMNIHRLVRKVGQIKLNKDNEKEILKEAIWLLTADIDIIKVQSIKKVFHAQSVWNYAYKYKELVKKFLEIPILIIYGLVNYGRYEEAFIFEEEEGDRFNDLFKFNFILRYFMKRYRQMALNYTSDGKVVVAEFIKYLKIMYKQRTRQCGPDHPITLNYQYFIACYMDGVGDFNCALKLLQNVNKKQKEILGQNSQITLRTQNNLAVVMCNLGQYEEALKLLNEIYEKRKANEELGPDHDDTLNVQNNIAGVLGKLGRYDDSLKLFQEVFEKRERLLGPDHMNTLRTQNNMGQVFGKLRLYDEALKILNSVYEKRRIHFGSEFSYTIVTKYNIALVMSNIGNNKVALKMHQEVYEDTKKQVGKDSPYILMIQHNLAVVMNDLEKYEESLKTLKMVFKKQKEQLGYDHPSTLINRHNIAIVKNNIGQYKDSIKLFEKTYEEQKKALGSHHPNTMASRDCMTKVMDNKRLGRSEILKGILISDYYF
jgi:tetratricopeptide (TPR) repeat protein